jgi:hypothetical protein
VLKPNSIHATTTCELWCGCVDIPLLAFWSFDGHILRYVCSFLDRGNLEISGRFFLLLSIAKLTIPDILPVNYLVSRLFPQSFSI